MNPTQLRQQCDTFVSGHSPQSPAKVFEDMANWCRTNQVEHDVYGIGDTLQQFEQGLANKLGFDAGLFVTTGTLAQATALRLACLERNSPLVALHASSHILIHERSNYQLLDHFKTLTVGTPFRCWTVEDLKAIPDRLGAVLYELPMREIGGQLPSWDELDAIKAYCREHGIHLHMDGARLWEAAAGYGRTLDEVARGFDSVYVSLYKGIGGLGGAMLFGTHDFIERARAWTHRQGGNIIHKTPYVISAAMQLESRIAAMPAYLQRARWLAEEISLYPQLRCNPKQPQVNMLHLHLPVSRERAIEIRDQIAQEYKVWIFNNAFHAVLSDHSYIEWYVGDNLHDMPDQRVREILQCLVERLKQN